MLPMRLEMVNFLAYRTPDSIYFDGIHLACLSGANGAGKSSILDAITWAIWGKSRARSDDDLIHIGEEEMSITLDFLQANEKYRIRRHRKIGRKRKSGGRSAGTTTLDLLGWVAEENTYRVISEPSIRQTQTHINAVVGLDYETFINSAYLQQGNADAFTVQTAANRKRILAEILNLDVWALYEKRAKDKLSEIEAELNATTAEIGKLEDEIAQEPGFQQEFERASHEYEHAHDQAEQAGAAFRELAGADIEFRNAKDNINRLKRDIDRQSKEMQTIAARQERLQQQIAQYQDIIERRESIEDGYARLVEAQAKNDSLGESLQILNQLNAQIYHIEAQIREEEAELHKEISSSSGVIERNLKQAEAVDKLQQEITDLRHSIGLLEMDDARVQTLQDEIAALRAEEGELKGENTRLKEQMDEIKTRIDTLEQAADTVCPACGQPLDEAHRLNLIAEYTEHGTTMGDTFRANKQRMETIKDEVKERQQSIRILQQGLSDLKPLQSKVGSIERQLQEAQNAEQEAISLQQTVDDIERILADRDFAHELQQELTALYEQRAALGYSQAAHSEIKETLDAYRGFQQEATVLKTALESLQNLQESLDETTAQLERYMHYINELQQQLSAQEEDLVELEARVLEMNRREKAWTDLRTTERQLHEKVIGLRQTLRAIEQKRDKLKHEQALLNDLNEDKAVFEEIKVAFSKNGIPTMVIEAAVPELEDATNHLLRRMTDGRLVVRFDTQREKKSGGVAETFDISISDELGTRDYQLYSGGEAFRINFAIRVAVSQLLARRAGAQLRTLFIDEGFGTQDAVGRERLVEAITAIQDDFDLILVITHIDELRDAFPVRLEVEKTSAGSRVRLM